MSDAKPPIDLPQPRWISLAAHRDARGSFTELWRQSAFPAGPSFCQLNLSDSEDGVLRGLHVHLRQDDYQLVLSGALHVNLVDLRPGQDLRRWTWTLRPGEALHVPAGVAHGYWALGPTRALYLVSAEYDGTDEHGLAWDDPTLALGWPGDQPLLSVRDQNNPRLVDLRLPGLVGFSSGR